MDGYFRDFGYMGILNCADYDWLSQSDSLSLYFETSGFETCRAGESESDNLLQSAQQEYTYCVESDDGEEHSQVEPAHGRKAFSQWAKYGFTD